MNWIILAAAVAIAAAVLALVGVGMAAASEGHWATAWACLGALAVILALTFFGIEFSTDFWKGK